MNIVVNGYSIWTILIITFATSVFLTAGTRKIAEHIGAIDIPDKRKIRKFDSFKKTYLKKRPKDRYFFVKFSKKY